MEQPTGLRVSHEAIYIALYALPRGEQRREMLSYLRQAKPFLPTPFPWRRISESMCGWIALICSV